MLPKPRDCAGCPFENEPGGFVPDEYVEGAEVLVLAQNPGDHEVKGEHLSHYDGGVQVYTAGPVAPMIGPTGHMMDSRYLPLAGLERGKDVSVANCVRCRYHDTNSLPPLRGKEIQDAIVHCQRAYFRPPASTRVVVAQGEYAVWATTGEPTWKEGHKVSALRGWLHPYRPVWEHSGPPPTTTHIFHPTNREVVVLAAFHLARLFREPWEEPAAIQDWRKVAWVLNGSWPVQMPPVERVPPAVWPLVSGFDTEYVPATRRLIRWSLAHEEHPHSHQEFPRLRVHVVEADYDASPYHSSQVQRWEDGRKVRVYSHNFVADLPYLDDLVTGVDLEDSMYQHAVLYSELEHTMDYLGSLYARINRWKHLEYVNPVEYSAGDAIGALDGGMALTRSLERDPASGYVYRNYMLPLLRPLSRYERGPGILLHPDRVKESLRALNRVKGDAQLRAQASAGWPLKLSGGGPRSQVSHQLFKVEKLK